MKVVLTVAVIVGAYLLGSIPVGLLLVRLTTGKDVRQIGSGRTGGTNVLRAAGPWVSALSILGDLAKGWLAVSLARTFVGASAVEALAGLFSVLGHNYSIFIGFDGGAGAATTVGSATALWPWSLPFLAAMGIPMIFITRHASVGSITIGLLLPIIFILQAWRAEIPWAYLIHGLGTMVLILWALRPNIKRLQAGTERRVELSKRAYPEG